MSFRTTTIIVVNTLTLFILAVTALFTANAHQRATAQRIDRQAQAMVKALGVTLAPALRSNQPQRLTLTLINYVQLPGINGIQVYDKEHKLITRYGPPSAVPDTPLVHLREENWRRLLQGNQTTDFVAPIEDGQVIGWVHLQQDGARITSARRDVYVVFIVLAAILMTVLTIAVSLGWRRPRSLIEAIHSFARKLPTDPRARLELPRWPAEMRLAMEELNNGAAALHKAHKEHEAERAATARNTAIVESSPDAVVVVDFLGQLIDCNPAAESLFGFPSEDIMGKLISRTLLHEKSSDDVLDTFEKQLEPHKRQRLELRGRTFSGGSIPLEVTIAPITANGSDYFSITLRDLSAQKKQEFERLATAERMQSLVRELERQKLAMDEHTLVSMADGTGRIFYANDKLAQISGYLGTRLLGKTFQDIADEKTARIVASDVYPAVEGGKVWSGELTNVSEEGAAFHVASTFVPLLNSSGGVDRIMCIQTDITPLRRAEKELARLRGSEISIGAHIQRSLLMRPLPAQAYGLDMTAYNEASQVIDGDFYDVHLLPGGLVDIVVGDVMGKGVPAAMLGAATKMQISSSLAEEVIRQIDTPQIPDPAQIMTSVNRSLSRHLHALDSFVTLGYYRFDTNRRKLIYVGCGHTEPLVLNRRTGKWRYLENQFPPVGVIGDIDFVQSETDYDQDDVVLMYSDGMTEATNPAGELFGEERTVQALSDNLASSTNLGIALQQLRQAVLGFEDGAKRRDDVTAVLVGQAANCSATDPSRHIRRIEANWDLNEIGAIRDLFQATAQDYALDPTLVDGFSLAAVEAFTNIVRHADQTLSGSPIEISLTPGDDRLIADFSYFSEPYVPDGPAEPDFTGESEGGFGLFIMESVCDRVTYRHDNGVNQISLIKELQVAAETV